MSLTGARYCSQKWSSRGECLLGSATFHKPWPRIRRTSSLYNRLCQMILMTTMDLIWWRSRDATLSPFPSTNSHKNGKRKSRVYTRKRPKVPRSSKRSKRKKGRRIWRNLARTGERPKISSWEGQPMQAGCTYQQVHQTSWPAKTTQCPTYILSQMRTPPK